MAQEKIAAGGGSLIESGLASLRVEKKDYVTSSRQRVTTAGASVGIGVAQLRSAMPTVLTTHAKSASVPEVLSVGTFASQTAPASNVAPDGPAPVATARETIAAVVAAIDALQNRPEANQKVVDLQYRVGDEHLALRVELRDGTVHTTFRTDSPELRSALAQEWRSVVQPASGSELRVADPVFSTSQHFNGEASFGSSGQGAAYQQHGEPGGSSARPPRVSEFSTPVTSDPVPVTPAANAAPQLLNAFA
jgi:hypothetical protein